MLNRFDSLGFYFTTNYKCLSIAWWCARLLHKSAQLLDSIVNSCLKPTSAMFNCRSLRRRGGGKRPFYEAHRKIFGVSVQFSSML